MRVIYTGQSIDSLEESLNFAIKEQELSSERASSLKDTLFDRADSLGRNPYKGQREDYLKHLKQEHRRIIEGPSKSFIELIERLSTSQTFLTQDKVPQK